MKIIQREDVFSSKQLASVLNETDELNKHIITQYYNDDKKVHRVSLDEHYGCKRYLSVILANINSVLYNAKLKKDCELLQDYAYARFNNPHTFTTNYTEYREEQEQAWHNDMEAHVGFDVFMSWIIYLTEDFKDGELVIKFGDEERTITPKINRLVIFPAYLEHMIVAPKYKLSQMRKTINGYMY